MNWICIQEMSERWEAGEDWHGSRIKIVKIAELFIPIASYLYNKSIVYYASTIYVQLNISGLYFVQVRG